LDWREDDNAFKHVQSDTTIPENINIETATGTKEFHDFEPQKLEQVNYNHHQHFSCFM